MIEIKVRDYRGAERADIACSPIALVAGKNGASKTSICQAVAAALTGNAIPISGVAKKDSGAIVRTGASDGSVEIRTETGLSRVRWPACSVVAEGDPPRASEIAAGIDTLLDYTAEGRARTLGKLLHADPTKEDLAVALGDAGLSDWAAAAWGLIEAHGWDGAHAARKEKGAKDKGRWEEITRQKYGSRKAASWLPEGWSDDIAAVGEAALAAAVTTARNEHHAAIAREAASGAKREALETDAADLPQREAALATAADQVEKINAEIRDLREQLAALPLPEAKPAPRHECPECHTQLVIVQRNLTEQSVERAPAPKPQPPEGELKRLRLRGAELEGALSNAEARLRQAEKPLAAAKVAVKIAERAKADLEKMPAEASAGSSAADAEAALTEAQRRLDAFRAKARADEIQREIAANDKLLDILAADGLRARKLARVLDAFNATQLAPLSERAGWKPVAVSPDMAIGYGGRDYRLLSASEQYRVRVVLQVAIARLDGSSMAVIDAADILDAPARSGLFGLVSDIPALIALTLSRREQLPDLAAADMGASYWVESGVAEPIGSAQREAA